MRYNALGAFEAMRSYSWLSEMYACEVTSKALEVPWSLLHFIASLDRVQLHKEQCFTATVVFARSSATAVWNGIVVYILTIDNCIPFL